MGFRGADYRRVGRLRPVRPCVGPRLLPFRIRRTQAVAIYANFRICFGRFRCCLRGAFEIRLRPDRAAGIFDDRGLWLSLFEQPTE